MKSLVSILLFAAASVFYAPAQDDGLSFVYMTREDMLNGNYMYKDAFAVYPNMGVNKNIPEYLWYIYKPVSTEVKVKGVTSSTPYKAWAITHLGQLFLNANQINGSEGYVRAFGEGRYGVVFVEAPRKGKYQEGMGITDKEMKQLRDMATLDNTHAITMGLMFGLAGFAATRKDYPVVPVIYDTHYDVLHIFNDRFYEILLERHQDLGWERKIGSVEEYSSEEVVELVRALNVGIDTPAAAAEE